MPNWQAPVDTNCVNAALPKSVADSQPSLGWSSGARRIATLWLLVHLAAVCVPPLSVEPASQLASLAFRSLQPYIDAMYLDHGYRFFAPEPGPSHLVAYELELPDGTRQAGEFPRLSEHRPRLFYHRHFMLSEMVNSLADFRPAAADAYARSYARHLLERHQAARVRLTLRRHLFPTPDQVLSGMRLDDPSLYRERPLGEFSRAQGWQAAPAPAETLPAGPGPAAGGGVTR